MFAYINLLRVCLHTGLTNTFICAHAGLAYMAAENLRFVEIGVNGKLNPKLKPKPSLRFVEIGMYGKHTKFYLQKNYLVFFVEKESVYPLA